MSYQNYKKAVYSILKIGVYEKYPIGKRQRISYFNTIIVSLPAVYVLFILYDFKGYLKPPAEWKFDQYSFFIFSLVCIFCLFLNHIEKLEISRILFLITWPILQHIIPIIVQNTPTDYYYAFPMGLVFHSLMIQVIYSSKHSPVKFSVFMILNFIMTLNFLNFLQYHDIENGSELTQLTHDSYYVLVVILYWFLFNMVIFYIMRVNEKNMAEISDGRALLEQQKHDIESAMNQLKASHENLIQSEKMASLGVFTSGIAHELNNPMNFIGSGTAILFDKLEKLKASFLHQDPQSTQMIDDLEQAKEAIIIGVEKSSKIINSLKNYARQDQGEHEIQNVIESINQALILIPNKLKHKVRIATDMPEKLELVCSINKLTQVFVNLIQNAIDACDMNGNIKINVFSVKKYGVIEISDNGEGIDKEDQRKIFDPFFTTKKVGQGTGLGLYIVHDLIKEHNGIIEYRSKKNEGTTFIIKLPMG